MLPSVPNQLNSKSLRVQIGLLYSLLAFVNIVFFSVMIFENQSDLLVNSFQLQSENLANRLLTELEMLQIDGDDVRNQTKLIDRLKLYDVNALRILDASGVVILQSPRDALESDFSIKATIEELQSELGRVESKSIFQSRYRLELNEENFSILLSLPFVDNKNQDYILQLVVYLSGIQDRLDQIYIFMAIATSWGIIFHVLFAIFLYRAIFRRLEILKETSEKLYSGDLTARALWSYKKNDELDGLGITFNSMADKIEETVNTVTRLNYEINQELLIGREVQGIFLPKIKDFSKFSVGTYYRPLRMVSGDIYLFYKIESDKEISHCFFLADASGHGISAALVTVMISMFLESILYLTSEPSQVIYQLSDLMASRLQSSFFATAVFAKIDSNNRLTICNAGHNAPILYKSISGQFVEIESSGPPLGMLEDPGYITVEESFSQDDKLFVYSDGLVETLDHLGLQFGFNRVKDHLKNSFSIQMSNQDTINSLQKDLEEHSSEFKDDVTMFLLGIKSE